MRQFSGSHHSDTHQCDDLETRHTGYLHFCQAVCNFVSLNQALTVCALLNERIAAANAQLTTASILLPLFRPKVLLRSGHYAQAEGLNVNCKSEQVWIVSENSEARNSSSKQRRT